MQGILVPILVLLYKSAIRIHMARIEHLYYDTINIFMKKFISSQLFQ